MVGQITDECSDGTDEAEADNKTCPPVQEPSRWYASDDEHPRHCEEVHEGAADVSTPAKGIHRHAAVELAPQ